MANPIETQDETTLALFMCMLDAVAIETEMKSIDDELKFIQSSMAELLSKRDALLVRYLALKERYDAHKANGRDLGVYE